MDFWHISEIVEENILAKAHRAEKEKTKFEFKWINVG